MDDHSEFLVLNTQVLVHVLSWQPQQLPSVSRVPLPFLISSVLVLATLFLFLRPLFCVFLLSLCLPAFFFPQVSDVSLLFPLLAAYVSPHVLPLNVSPHALPLGISLLFPLVHAQIRVAFLFPVQTLYPVE